MGCHCKEYKMAVMCDLLNRVKVSLQLSLKKQEGPRLTEFKSSLIKNTKDNFNKIH